MSPALMSLVSASTVPHSRPARTSTTSSLKRRSEAMVVAFDRSAEVVQTLTASKPALEAAIRAKPEFVAVSAPQNLEFLRDRALLYLSPEDLDAMAERLADAQPVLTAIAEDPSLRGVLEVLGDAVANADDAEMFATVLDLVTRSGEHALAGGPQYDQHAEQADDDRRPAARTDALAQQRHRTAR